ncbi:hypothetical protein OC861_004947 [Tilletia horrida]|nr:hypothetical protein OC861_004947 [Tilletia horrida]
MSSDARSLLRAAAAQRRTGIQDRWASYHPTTQALRCVACAYLPIKHESLWSSHAASKSHRNSVARLLREETAAAAVASRGKRKQSEQSDTAAFDVQAQGAGSADAAATPDAKRARLGHQNGTESAAAATTSVDEDEWARFQREVLEAPANGDAGGGAGPSLDNAIHAAATISAEPVLLVRNPEDEEDDAEGMETDGAANAETQDALTEEELRLEREREEREDILMRFEEEQRIQDEAEERVNALKNRIRDFKAARIAKQGSVAAGVESTGSTSSASTKAKSNLGKQFSKALSSRSKS